MLALRARQVRNFLVTLLTSQGVPMILGGDEIGRTQHGNNNAYCQDNEISWYDWDAANRDLFEFTRRVVRLRHEHPVLRRRNWFAGHPLNQPHADELPDAAWFAPDGTEMSEEQWSEAYARSLAVFLNGSAIASRNRRGEVVVDDSFLLLFNAADEDVTFTLPDSRWGKSWSSEIDTAQPHTEQPLTYAGGEDVTVTARSVQVLLRPRGDSAD